MTGTARVQGRPGGVPISIFLRSLNHKFLDLSFRLPAQLQNFEDRLSNRISKTILRGRIDVEISGRLTYSRPRLNRPVLDEYRRIVNTLGGDPASPAMLPVLLKMPGVMVLEDSLPPELPVEAFWELVDRAVLQLQKARKKEGRKIEKLFRGYIKRIDSLAGKIKVRQDRFRSESLRKFRAEVDWLSAASSAKGPPGSALTSTYLEWFEKFTIAEELERISMHTAEIGGLLSGAGAVGRQIDFYCQELNREANTIGSKVRDFQIRKFVVEIKTIIEDMKEQVRNLC